MSGLDRVRREIRQINFETYVKLSLEILIGSHSPSSLSDRLLQSFNIITITHDVMR
jgi:hypothetical protein